MEQSQADCCSVWKAYIRFSRRLQTIDPIRYETVPDAVKRLTPEQINALTEADIQTLQNAGALPQINNVSLSMETIRAIRAYLLAQKPNLPPILQSLTEDEIQNLGPDKAQALRYLNLLPDALPENTELQTSASHPMPAPIPEQSIPGQPIPPMPEYDYMGYPLYGGYRHDPLMAIERAGQLYNEAARNFTRSIEKQNDAMGRAFRKAGG